MANVNHSDEVAILAGAIDECIDNKISAIKPYDLPVAGASTLGGFKVGAGLSMAGDVLTVATADDNQVNAIFDSIFGAQGGISNG